MIKSLRFFAVATVAAFALAACDESPVDVTGTISGSVTIEGAGASAVTVSLSSGASTATDASGNFTFTDVTAGSYVVTISGFPADASFSTTSTTAVIASAGQVASANFSGSFIRTSGIVGNVSVATVGPVAGVAVALSGAGTAATTTDAAGQYAFTGLRAGDYTVTISGFDVAHTFASASQAATVGAGATEVVSFSGTLVSNASISGALYFDENDKNDTYDGAALEALVAAPNVLITLNGPSIGQTQSTQTDSTGSYVFTDLVSGTYAVVIADTDADIPANVAFGGASNTQNVTLTPGGSGTAYFPFDITQQSVSICQFTGIDGVSPGHNPVAGGIISLFFLEANVGGVSPLPAQTTDETGCTDFIFDRADDISPSPGVTDNIVYASMDVVPPTGYTRNGEASFEISYDPKTASSLASDTFDVQSGVATLAFDAISLGGVDTLASWIGGVWADTTAGPIGTFTADANGVVYNLGFVNPAHPAPSTELFFRLEDGNFSSALQALALGHDFDQAMLVDSTGSGTVVGSFLSYQLDGFNLQADTAFLGSAEAKFLDADAVVQVYHEADDSLGTSMFTFLDDQVDAAGINVTLMIQRPDSFMWVATAPATGGSVTFPNLWTDSVYSISADTVSVPVTGSPLMVLAETMYVGLQDWGGASLSANQCQQMGSACGTFGYKFTNNSLDGTIEAFSDGTPVEGLSVRIQADSATIQPHPLDTTVVTDNNGDWTTDTNMTEGIYTISIADSVTAAGDTVWAIADSLRTCSADTEGDGGSDGCDFDMVRMDTEVMGVVINDRDQDGNTIDPGEALDGVTIRLYNGGAAVDSMLVDSTTTSSNGYYAFNKLPEGMYTVEADASTASLTATVLQSLDGAGSPVTTQTVTTAADPTLGSDFTRQVGDTVAGSNGLMDLPFWDYDNSVEDGTPAGSGLPTHFTFLARNTTVTGKAVALVAGGTPVSGLIVSLQRCVTSGTASTVTSPATGGTCDSYFPTAPVSITTGADGVFNFPDLEEGQYEVTINLGSVTYTSASETNLLYEVNGAGDVEAAAADVVLN